MWKLLKLYAVYHLHIWAIAFVVVANKNQSRATMMMWHFIPLLVCNNERFREKTKHHIAHWTHTQIMEWLPISFYKIEMWITMQIFYCVFCFVDSELPAYNVSPSFCRRHTKKQLFLGKIWSLIWKFHCDVCVWGTQIAKLLSKISLLHADYNWLNENFDAQRQQQSCTLQMKQCW